MMSLIAGAEWDCLCGLSLMVLMISYGTYGWVRLTRKVWHGLV